MTGSPGSASEAAADRLAAYRLAAQRLADNRLAGERFGGLPAGLRPESEVAAYAIQAHLHQRLVAEMGSPLAGHKIGCTTPVMQAYLGITNPCAGGILARDVQRTPGRRRAPAKTRLGVECELAVHLGRELTAGPFHASALGPAVRAVLPAIEIVEDRYVDYRRLDTPTLIADDFFNAGCVLGPAREDWQALDLRALGGVMRINGHEAGRGCGADILGHPFEALAWLAGLRLAEGTPLRAGTFVLLGSLVQTVWLDAGDRVEIGIEGLGAASLEVV